MTSSKIRDSVQVGNGLQADFQDLRNTKDPQTEERDEVSLINGNGSDYRERDYDSQRGAAASKGSLVIPEISYPSALSIRLSAVRGFDRQPDEELQEVLRAKLCDLEADSGGIRTLFSELSAQLLSINSEEDTIFITFKSFEELWRFHTHYTMGFLGHCMENLLLDQDFWLSSLEQENAGIEAVVQEEMLNLLYKGILIQEGSFFGRCTANQMFDSSTSGRDLYLEQGDIGIFEPPFMGSDWTVQSLVDGSRGTKCRPAVEPIIPFHQWFLKSCCEHILVGRGKLTCDFPCQFATGSCVATRQSDASSPDELSFERGDVIHVVGLLVSCLQWFLGRHEGTGSLGLVRSSFVKPASSLRESPEIFLEDEDGLLNGVTLERVKAEALTQLRESCRNDIGAIYRLDLIEVSDFLKGSPRNPSSKEDIVLEREELRTKVDRILKELSTLEADTAPAEEVETSLEGNDEGDQEAGGEGGSVCFTVSVTEDGHDPEGVQPLLAFLNVREYQPQFAGLYHFSLKFVCSLFRGHSDEEELVAYLGAARETARKRRLFWAQSRLCFLLGKLCARRVKLSQARVYFEEALGITREDFADWHLLTAIHANLAVVYLTQKNTEKYVDSSERVAALRMGVGGHVCSTGREPEVLRYALKKAVLAGSKAAEARVCFLLAKLHCTLGESWSAVPFVERLQVLMEELPGAGQLPPSHGYLALGRLYSESGLPHLATSSLRRASLHPSASLETHLSAISFVLEKQGERIPPQAAPYLRRALALTENTAERSLRQAASMCLSYLLQGQRLLDDALRCMGTLLDSGLSKTPVDATDALLFLAWLHIRNRQPLHALHVLEGLLDIQQIQGVVQNMRAIALRHTGDAKRAAASYRSALDACEEIGSLRNLAVALANRGLLYWHVGAETLGEASLLHAVETFSQLKDEGHEEDFFCVLLELGRFYVSRGQLELEKGKLYYEWALLTAINSGNLHCQLQACRCLCHFYHTLCPDAAQSIIYNERQLVLLRRMGHRSHEGDILETISELYMGLGTDRAYRAALEHTKCSLGLFIDLHRKEKEAFAWLKAGKIYHILGQDELVDLYLQVAQDSGLSTGNTAFLLGLLEVAGDLFFNSSRDRDKALSFYRDRALPIAIRTGDTPSQLRLCNKLTELLMHMQLHRDAVEFAQASLDLSITLGEHLNERVAFHRLGTLYHQLGQLELAEHYYLKALSLCPSPLQFEEETLYYVRVYLTLGDIIFYDLKDPYDAAGYYHLALAAAMDLGNKRAQLKLCTRLATIYHNFLVDRELSLFFYQRARGFATELNVRRINLSPEQHFCSTSRYKTGAT
uniref:SH3 domain and tetratricopeptide repeats 1 n=1 Tax=Paramormyrops kingsleyae TaxID=1676925 RepID=A0A3B3RMJ3_9TELE|nr:SH3 domain and tetratricopeptide repeat-containing protein 1 [Paramormyrops kingsleyae]